MIVADSTVLAARSLAGTGSALARQVEARDPVWIAPSLWRFEFQNILAKAIWARQITPEDATIVWADVTARMSENEADASAQIVLALSARHRISAYDANFVALAMEMGVVCVTEDRELQTKFPALAFGMASFLRHDTAGGEVREPGASYRVRPLAKRGRRV